MKKRYTIVFLLLIILCASLLGACGEKTGQDAQLLTLEPEAAAAPAPKEAPAANAPAENVPAQGEAAPRHIVDTINECHTIDADVYGPASEQVARHRMDFLSVTVEEAVAALCPGDAIVSKETPQDRPYTVATTAGGKQIQVDPTLGMVSLRPPFESDPGWEAVYLNGERYFADHPEKKGTELDFMTAAEAKDLAAKAFQNLGVALEPEFTLCAGLKVGELDAYVKELRTEDEFMKDLLRGVKFPGLAEDESCYVLKVSFRYDGIHMQGFDGEPRPTTEGWGHLNIIQCGMVISADGIEYLESYGLLANPETLDSAPVVSPEEALEAYKNLKDANFSLEFESVVTKVFLEYVPIPDGEQVILTPYWCVESHDTTQFPDMHAWQMSTGWGARLNAYTCADLAKRG